MKHRVPPALILLLGFAAAGKADCPDRPTAELTRAMDYAIGWTAYWFDTRLPTEDYSAGTTLQARAFRTDKTLNVLLPDITADVYLTCTPGGRVIAGGYPVAVYGDAKVRRLERMLRESGSVAPEESAPESRDPTGPHYLLGFGGMERSVKSFSFPYVLPDFWKQRHCDASAESQQRLSEAVERVQTRARDGACGSALTAKIPCFSERDELVFVLLEGNKCGGILDLFRDPLGDWTPGRTHRITGGWSKVAKIVREETEWPD